MAIDVQLFKVSKRVNSLFVPPSAEGATVHCTLNEECGVVAPHLILASVPDYNPVSNNYAYIKDFNRYYWIKEWKWLEGRWHCFLKSDVLASWRDTIINRSYYFLRSSAKSNGSIIDNMYPFTNGQTTKSSVHKLFEQEFTSWTLGSIIVTIVGADGALNYLEFDVPDFELFCTRVFSNTDWMKLTGSDISDTIAKLATNPFQYVVNAMWIPFSISNGTGESDVVKLGYWEVEGHHYKLIGNLVYGKKITIPTSVHPDSSHRGDFLNHGRYNQITLFSPMFGTMSIDTMKLPSGGSIDFSFRFDARSGQAEFMAKTSSSLLGYTTCQFGVPIQLTDLQINPLQALSDITGGVMTLLQGSVLGMAQGLSSAVSELSPTVTVKGAQGSTLLAVNQIIVYQSVIRPVTEDNADNGRPLCENGNMKTLGTGYYIVDNGSTPCNGAMIEETKEVASLLEGGVYY